MVKTNKRLWICSVLIVINVAFIWGNSLLPGTISGAISDGLKAFLEKLLGVQEGPPGGGGLLRKVAHITEFACLGVLFRWLFGMLLRKKWQYYMLPTIAGIMVACVDETIQLFTPNRGPGIKDVGIDTLGLVLGICMISLLSHIKNQMKENKL